MLVARIADRGREQRIVLFGCLVARQAGESRKPRHGTLDAVLELWRELLGLVERADRDRNAVAADIVECQRCAAIAAEAAFGLVRAFEDRELAASDLERARRDPGQRREERAERFLAHAAVTDGRAGRYRVP